MKYLHIPGPTAVCVTILLEFCKTTCIYCAGFCAGFCAGLCAVAMLHRRRIAVASPHRIGAASHRRRIASAPHRIAAQNAYLWLEGASKVSPSNIFVL